MVAANSASKHNSAKGKNKEAAAERGSSPNAVQEAMPGSAIPVKVNAPVPGAVLQKHGDPKVEDAPIVPVRQTARAIEDKVEKETEEPESLQVKQLVAQAENPVAAPVEKQVEPVEQDEQVQNKEAKVNGAVPVEEGVVTTFEWSATDAKEVILVGSFNEWRKDLVMTKHDGKFSVDISLQPGKHFYKFIADGEWCYDFRMPNEPDSCGNMNNTVIVAQV